MALVLKTDKTFTPQSFKRMGLLVNLSDCYGVVDHIEYDKGQKQCVFSYDIYADKAARDNNLPVIDRYNFSFNGVDFDRELGQDGFTTTQAYEYLAALPDLSDWQSDE